MLTKKEFKKIKEQNEEDYKRRSQMVTRKEWKRFKRIAKKRLLKQAKPAFQHPIDKELQRALVMDDLLEKRRT